MYSHSFTAVRSSTLNNYDGLYHQKNRNSLKSYVDLIDGVVSADFEVMDMSILAVDCIYYPGV